MFNVDGPQIDFQRGDQMKTAFCVLPEFNDFYYKLPHLGAACIKSYLKERGIKIDIYDMRYYKPELNHLLITKRYDLYDYIAEIPDLILILSIMDKYNRKANVEELLEMDVNLITFHSERHGLKLDNVLQNLKLLRDLIKEKVNQFKDYDNILLPCYESNIYTIVLFSACLKVLNPKLRIICGGPQITQSNLTCKLLLNSGIFFSVVRGEGEETCYKLLDQIAKQARIEDIAYVYTQSNIDLLNESKKIKNGVNLNDVPLPDFQDFDLSQYNPGTLPVFASRGCTNYCDYCSEALLHGKLHIKSVEKIVSELEEYIEKYQVNHFVFADSLLNFSLKWLDAFCDQIIAKQIKCSWDAFFRPNLPQEICIKLKMAGLKAAVLGAESLDDDTLSNMNKEMQRDNILLTIDNLLKNGIDVRMNFISGYLGESEEQAYHTLNNWSKIIEKYNSKRDGYGKIFPYVHSFHIRSFSKIYERPHLYDINFSFYDASLFDLSSALQDIVGKIPEKYQYKGANIRKQLKERYQMYQNKIVKSVY